MPLDDKASEGVTEKECKGPVVGQVSWRSEKEMGFKLCIQSCTQRSV